MEPWNYFTHNSGGTYVVYRFRRSRPSLQLAAMVVDALLRFY